MSDETTVSCYVVGFLLAPASKVSSEAPTVHVTRCKDNVRRFITGHLEGAVPATRGRIEKVIGVHHIEFDTEEEVSWCSAMIESIKESGEWPEPTVAANGVATDDDGGEEPEAPRARRTRATAGVE